MHTIWPRSYVHSVYFTVEWLQTVETCFSTVMFYSVSAMIIIKREQNLQFAYIKSVLGLVLLSSTEAIGVGHGDLKMLKLQRIGGGRRRRRGKEKLSAKGELFFPPFSLAALPVFLFSSTVPIYPILPPPSNLPPKLPLRRRVG